MNASNNAVTEYDSYQFDSFAMLGDKIIAVGTTGLFELSGGNDGLTCLDRRRDL